LPSIFDFSFKQDVQRRLGVDIEARREDIRSLFFKRQAPSLVREGLDPEDVLQEVFKGLLIRNKGTCPYDPEKAAFSTYVVMVMNCIVMNVVNKHRKDSGRCDVGSKEDIADSPIYQTGSYEEDPMDNLILEEMRSSLQGDFLKVYDALMDGWKVSHIASNFGWENKKVSHLVKEVRKKVHAYMEGEL
jgi:DNA-directed RNA polymerase specialized sigma24 family protein